MLEDLSRQFAKAMPKFNSRAVWETHRAGDLSIRVVLIVVYNVENITERVLLGARIERSVKGREEKFHW